MAELADAADSKSAEGNLMGVRFPLPAPPIFFGKLHCFEFSRPISPVLVNCFGIFLQDNGRTCGVRPEGKRYGLS